MPESFKVLIKELQSLGLNVRVLSEEDQEVEFKDDDDDVREMAKELGLEIEGPSVRGEADQKRGYGAEAEESEESDDDLDDIEREEEFDEEESPETADDFDEDDLDEDIEDIDEDPDWEEDSEDSDFETADDDDDDLKRSS